MTRGVMHGVTKRYGRHFALADVTLTVGAGEILALIGPNGAGKTTLLRLLARLLRPTSGSVETTGPIRYFAGEHTLPPAVHLSQWLTLWSATIAEPVTRKTLGALSRGTRQRVGLEAMLADRSTELLVLDEPWEGLDPDASRWLSNELRVRRDTGAGVIVSSHRIHDLAGVCDRCVFLAGGRLRSDSATAEQLSAVSDRSAFLFAAFDRLKQP
ncbi:MAG TPA: ATP-binding cassette domain-containing protein [Vicinamibacterales bacterium]|nr:ATP-binding cassette domain-containing protein [Vicinamibacterales bacterium]